MGGCRRCMLSMFVGVLNIQISQFEVCSRAHPEERTDQDGQEESSPHRQHLHRATHG